MHLKLFLVCAFIDWRFANCVEAGRIERSESRIVGGHNVTKQYPYQVSVEVPRISIFGYVLRWRHSCGGSIITQRHILTAAHCVVSNKTSTPNDKISVLAGTQNLKEGGTRYSVCRSLFHSKYLDNDDSVSYDIAIITVKDAITFVPDKIAAIAIPQKNETTQANVTCVLTGWGSTIAYGKGPHPNTLQELQELTISNEDCQKIYSIVTQNNLCTLTKQGEGGCDGDSGGPLVDNEKNVQVGVITNVSGVGCAKGVPDIYTRVSAFYDWIQHFTTEEGGCDVS